MKGKKTSSHTETWGNQKYKLLNDRRVHGAGCPGLWAGGGDHGGCSEDTQGRDMTLDDTVMARICHHAFVTTHSTHGPPE